MRNAHSNKQQRSFFFLPHARLIARSFARSLSVAVQLAKKVKLNVVGAAAVIGLSFLPGRANIEAKGVKDVYTVLEFDD